MNGKKAAIILVGIIAIAVILVVTAMLIFFSVYEPKDKETNNTILNSIIIPLEQSKNTSIV